VLKCKATEKDDPTVDPRFGKIGKQTIEDTGALTKKRVETIDDETSAAANDYMKRQKDAGKPFFRWFNATRMHLRTHVRAEHRGRYKHGDSEYIDGMIEYDERSARSSRRSTTWASRATRSSSTPATMART
jgi:arylsulfatase A-like enzyme